MAAVLSQGMRGTDVITLQKMLNALGASPALDVDGIFGPLTGAALRAFQKQSNLPVTGVVDASTRTALLSAEAALSANVNAGIPGGVKLAAGIGLAILLGKLWKR